MLLLQIVVCVFSRFLITSAPAVDFQHETESLKSDSSYEDLFHDITTGKPEDKLGSCIIPTISNGSLWYYPQPQTIEYIQLPVGIALRHGERAILLCTEGFVPQDSSDVLGAQSSTDTITCENGMWSKPLLCKPASCLGKPPPIDNGYPMVNIPSHGHVINYICNKHHVKVQSGIVKCHYGKWKGRPPVCAYVEIPFNSTTISTVSIQATTAMGVISRKTRDSNTVLYNDAAPSALVVKNILPEDCMCSYFHHDRYLQAIVNGRLTLYGVRIRKGETGLLRCANSSMNLVWPNGACNSKSVTVTCNECDKWKEDEMPSCQFTQLDSDIQCTKFSHKDMYNLSVHYDDKDSRVGSRAIFSCQRKNQKINGANEAVCLRSGEWSTQPPECTDVKTDVNLLCNETRCARFSNEDVDQLTVTYDDNDVRVGSTASFSCRNSNQIMNGTSIAMCLRNGAWSSPPPPCKEPQTVCPPVLENGAFDVIYSNDRNINSTATFYCKDVSHLTEGIHIRTCLSTGKWSIGNPTCRVSDVHCSKFSDEDTNLLDVYYDDSGFLVGSTATFSCIKEGQRLNGSAIAVCLRTEEWSSPPPQCIAISCDVPEKPENGDVFYRSLKFGSMLVFTCKDGHRLHQTKPVYCTANGTWSITEVSCREASCEIPLSPEHGTLHLLGDSKVNSLALYSCNRGWKLVGSTASKCLITGQWTSLPPMCVAEKSSSSFIIPTAIVPTANTVVAVLPERKETSVEKEEKDIPKPSKGITHDNNCSCTYNSHDRKLSADVNGLGLWNGDKVRKGDKMTLRCYDQTKNLVLPNATSISGTFELTCDVCRVWEDSDLPSCEDVRSGPCVLSAIPNGGVGYLVTRRVSRYKTEERFVEFEVGKIFQEGETAIFRCRDGFEPVGSSQLSEDWRRSREVVTCKDGQWSKSLECKPESCYGEPPSVDNGYPVVNNRSHGFGIYYQCDNYYVKASRDDVECSYGQWIGEAPRCIDGRCYVSQLNHPGLEKPPVGFLEHGKDYPATCMKGFKASSRRMKISCNTGKWNVSDGICVPDTCDGDPPPMDNGHPVVTNRSHGSGIYYLCRKYYVKSGKKGNVKCSYGQWTGNTSTCIDGRCYVSQLSHPGLEKPPMNFLEHGKDYPATCMKGFKALNQWIKVSCDAGRWNVSAANCVEVDVFSTPVSAKAEEHVSRQPENCFCIFNSRSEHLAAVVNGVPLEYDSPVKKGDAALLSCTDPRLHLFWPNGMRTLNANMTCEVCEAWGSSDLPSCELTETGDSFIVLNENVKVQPGGAVASHLNRNLKIGCINWNTNYPDWRTPRIGAESVSIFYGQRIVDQRYMLYQSFVNIQNFGQQHAGSYECSTRTPDSEQRSLRPTKLDLITDCNDEPHEIPHGKYSIQSRSHRSRVEYECDDSYETTGPSTVQCLHGKWMGQPPQCIKANPAATVPVGHDVTSMGTSNNPTPKPFATRESSLGEKDDCFCIYNNPDRSLSATYYNRRLWYGDKVKKNTWTRLECADKVMHLVLPNGTEITAGSARLPCRICETWEVDQLPTCERFYHAGVTCLQIKITNDIEIKYSNGRRVGSIATFSCTDSSLELVGRNVKCLENGMWDSNQRPYCQRISVPDKVPPNPPASKESKSEEDCVCTYSGDWKLKALVNGERIWRGTNIKKGESIQLGCDYEGNRLVLPNGTMIMSESVTWTCYRCGAWGASEIPTCKEVQRPGTPVSDKNRPNSQASKESTSEEDCVCTYFGNWRLKALVNGLRIWRGTNVKKGESIQLECDEEGNRLVLPNGTMIMSGRATWTCYRCGAGGASEMPTCEVVQRRAVTCPQLEITEGITVKYTNERRVGSTATFSCIVPFVLHGPSSILHCQQTGVWDRIQPTCRKPEIRCPPIPETDVFSVQFTNYRKINSTAYFRCKDIDFKIVGGLDTRTCQPSGEWSGANPDCEAPGCLIEDFIETAPRNLVPSMEGVSENLQPVGSELSMLCEAGYVLTEKKKATCGPLGEWNFGKVQCVVGCQLDIEDEYSALIITPYNNYYRIGQSIVVSCSEGFELTSDVERVMCMKNGWSDTIPNCKNETNQ